jgi:hypothetical protein
MKVLSLFRPATPRGAVRSYFRSSFTPPISSARLTSSLIESSSLEPRLIGVAISRSQCMIQSIPITQSSMYMKLRVWVPSPQTTISCFPDSLASMTLRQIAAGAFSRPPSHVPQGPYTLWKRAMWVSRWRSAQYSWQNISDMSFSQP